MRIFEPNTLHPAIAQLLAENRALLEGYGRTGCAYLGKFCATSRQMPTSASRGWGQVSHLNAVVNSPELREAYNANLPLVTQYYAELGQDQDSVREIQALRNGKEFENLGRARKKILRTSCVIFASAAPNCHRRKRSVFSRSRKSYQRSLPISTITCWTPPIISYCMCESARRVSGIPDDALQMAKGLAEQEGVAGWKFTLACAVIHAGHAVCGQPGAAGKNVSRLFHSRQRDCATGPQARTVGRSR